MVPTRVALSILSTMILGLTPLFITAPARASGIHHHGGQTVVVLPQTSVAYMQPTYSHVIQMSAPASTSNFVQFAPIQIPAVQLVPVSQPRVQATWVQADPAPSGQVIQFTPAAASYTTQGGASVQWVPQYGSTQQSGMVNLETGVLAGSGRLSDLDYQILTTGFGGSHIRLQGLVNFLKQQIENLIRQKGGLLTEQELTTLLIEAAKGFMMGNGFGFLINEAIEPIIKRLISQLLRDRQGTTPSAPDGNTPAPPAPGPNGNLPAPGAITYEVSGRIVLTPSSGQAVSPGQHTSDVTPLPPPSSVLPKELENLGGRVAPSPP